MKELRQIVSMLFSDIKAYSDIRNDELHVKLKEINDEFERQHLSSENHFFSKTWGDAYFICSYDPVDLVDISLNLRDKYRNTNWKRQGFSKNFQVRIGLHTEKARILSDNNQVIDVVGKNITSAARIEPIVEPNHVFCSDMFYSHLTNEPDINCKLVPLGTQKLAKNFGDMNLFRVLRPYEAIKAETSSAREFPKTKIKRKISDKDITDFLRKTFLVIYQYFDEALKDLKKKNADLETDFNKVTEHQFTCEIFINGESKTICQIWLNIDQYSKEILYSNSIASVHSPSYNEAIGVKHDGFEMWLEPTIGMYLSFPDENKNKSPEEAADYLWRFFTKQLEY